MPVAAIANATQSLYEEPVAKLSYYEFFGCLALIFW